MATSAFIKQARREGERGVSANFNLTSICPHLCRRRGWSLRNTIDTGQYQQVFDPLVGSRKIEAFFLGFVSSYELVEPFGSLYYTEEKKKRRHPRGDHHRSSKGSFFLNSSQDMNLNCFSPKSQASDYWMT